MQAAIPLRGRMIHKLNGDLDSQLYDRDGQVSIRLFAVNITLPQGHGDLGSASIQSTGDY